MSQKPTLEEIAQAYKELRTSSLALSIRSWDEQLRQHEEEGAMHPQELRSQNVQIWMEARKKFWGLMERLIGE